MFKNMVDQEDNVRIQKGAARCHRRSATRSFIANYKNGLMSFQDFNTITNDFVGQQLSMLSAQFNAVLAEAGWEEARGIGAIP